MAHTNTVQDTQKCDKMGVNKKPVLLTRQRANLQKRIDGFEAGKRYAIYLTAGREIDWTVVELGKVER